MSLLLRSTSTPYWRLTEARSRVFYRYPAGQVLQYPNKDNRNEWGISWPPTRLFGSGNLSSAVHFRPCVRFDAVPGNHATRAFSGVTRDNASAPLGNAAVKLFRTATNELIAQGASDANGNYTLVSPYADGHFINAYLAGSPDVAGTTVNTLTGA